MGRGCPPTPESPWVREPVKAVWRRGPTWKGHALLLRARRSEFRFPTEAPRASPFLSLMGAGRVPVMMEPQEIEDEGHERIVERVAAIDVAKASGMVCVRVPHESRPGRRGSRVWEVAATTGAVTGLGDHLACQGIE